MKKVKKIYAKDFVQPLVENLSENGEREICFNPFINAVLSCRFEYPRFFENTKKEDIVSELDKMAYLDEIKFGREGNETVFQYTGKERTEIDEELASKEAFASFSNSVRTKLGIEQNL